MVSPSPSPVPPVTGLSTADWIDPIKIVLGLIAGLWALYLYWRTRQGQARVAVEPMTRFVGGESANAALLVALRITNSSKVAFFYDSAIARLMDASSRAPDGTVVLVPFSEQDPFVPVYGAETGDSEAISQGRLFAIDPKEEIMLEPRRGHGDGLSAHITGDRATGDAGEDPGVSEARVRVEVGGSVFALEVVFPDDAWKALGLGVVLLYRPRSPGAGSRSASLNRRKRPVGRIAYPDNYAKVATERFRSE
jgi:hypothetical protein